MKYCQNCIMPTSRPGMRLNNLNICNACLWHEKKKTIDWKKREQEFLEIAKWAKDNSKGPWDCVLGVSGGKDSTWQALLLKKKFGLNPLLVQYVSSDGTELGRVNIENLVRMGFDLISVQPSPPVAQALSKRSYLEYGNLQKHAELALFSSPFRMAIDYEIPLVLFGENPALEAGDKNEGEGWDATQIINNNTLGGHTYKIWLDNSIHEKDLCLYQFPTDLEFRSWQGKGIFMGYFLNWSGWKNGVIAIQNGMKCITADYRDIGVHYKHNSLDSDNAGIVNAMLKHIKFGFGNTTELVCYDIRDGRISREEGALLVRELDGVCHDRYINSYCDWVGITVEQFWTKAEQCRGDMWVQQGEGWKLQAPIWEQVICPDSHVLDDIIARVDTRRVIWEDGCL